MLLDAVSKAVATNEVNAAMGTICATPTAGSAGVVPGTLFALQNKLKPNREQKIEFLFTAGAFGFIVANNASISGAAGDVRQRSVLLRAWQRQQLLKWQEGHRHKVQKRWQ